MGILIFLGFHASSGHLQLHMSLFTISNVLFTVTGVIKNNKEAWLRF